MLSMQIADAGTWSMGWCRDAEYLDKRGSLPSLISSHCANEFSQRQENRKCDSAHNNTHY